MSPVATDAEIAREAAAAVARARGELVAAPGESAAAPRRQIGEPSGEGGVEGRGPKSETPAGPQGFYRDLRGRGYGHERAVELLLEAYPSESHSLGRWIEKARAQAEAPEPEPKSQPEPEPDSLDVAELGVLERIESLQADERRLSIDTFADDEAARKEARTKAATVADELRAAEDELRRIDLARTERKRRVVEQREQEAEESRSRARAEVKKLDREVASKATKADAAMAAAATELAAFSDVWARRRQALIAAGEAQQGTGGYPVVQITSAIQHHLVQASAPAVPIDIERMRGAKYCPLSEAR